jgi:hypothetical protein
MADLPENYRVVGVGPGASMVPKTTWEIIRIQQNGSLTVAAIAARRRLGRAASDYRGDV